MKAKILELFTVKGNKHTNIMFVCFLFISCNLLSALIPPFQSPDEFDHITRAYLFEKGIIILDAPLNETSGGYIDSGLARYMDVFSSLPFHPERKLIQDEIEESKKIRWSKSREFKSAPGVALYFPAIYSIHGVGLAIGEYMNLTIDSSYKLTRFILLLSICCILYISFQLYQPSILVLALLIIPMTLFQFSSASLDGIATALSIFVVSAFLRISIDREHAKKSLIYALMIAWILIASSRAQLFPLILLLGSCGYFTRKSRYFYISALLGLIVIAWQIVAMKTNIDGRVKLGATTSSIAIWYLNNPLSFIDVLKATLISNDTWRSYLSSFFGMLGWLDTPFVGKEYLVLFTLNEFITTVSTTYQVMKNNLISSLMLIFIACLSVLLIYFALLVTWTPHPAVVVKGVVGRYFLIPVIMVIYALSNSNLESSIFKRIFGLLCLIVLWIYSLVNTAELLISRYY